MAKDIVLLNADYSFIDLIDLKHAIKLIVKGRVETIKVTDKICSNFENTFSVFVPKILKLINYIKKMFKVKIPYSKKNIFIRDNYTCQYCGKKIDKPEIEHVIPESRGGKATWENIVASCKACNVKKRNRTPSEAGMFLKRQPYQPTIMEFIQMKLKNLNIHDLMKEIMEDI